MPWTNPIPTQPNKQWMYINNTTSILGNTANEDSLICWLYAQGYTGVILYQLNQLTSGNAFTPANAALLTAFINKCNTNGIEVGGAFGGTNTMQAMIGLGGFTAAVSEIEWWNYSHNLPYQKQDSTGAYSFYDSLQMFMSYKTQLNNAGIQLIAYAGILVRNLNYAYDYKYPVVAEYKNPTTQGPNANGNLGFAIKGNFTTDLAAPIVETNVFQPNEVIKINNFPNAGLSTYAKLDATTPLKLESGNTTFNVASAETSNNLIIPTGYRKNISVTSYSIASGAYTFNAPGGHGLTAGNPCIICTDYTARPEFNLKAGAYNSDIQITSVTPTSLTTLANIIGGTAITYQVTAGTLRINFSDSADVAVFFTGDTIRIGSVIGPIMPNTNYVVTNKGTTWIEVFNAAWANTALTQIAGAGSSVFVWTRALVTFPSPVIFYPEINLTLFNSPTVSNLHEVVYIGLPRFAGPGAGEIALRGNKTYHFALGRVSKIALQNYGIPYPSNLFEITGSVIYDAGLNQTRIFLTTDPTTYVGSGPEYTTFLAMANLDVVYQTNSAYGTPGSELQQLIPYVNSYAITVYEQNIPSYGYIGNRVRQIGQGIAAISGAYTPKVYYLFGAYTTGSMNFYRGLDALSGNTSNPWPRKGAKEAYDYVSFTLSPLTPTINSPSQTGSPISAEAETDADVQAWVQIEGLLMFKVTDFVNPSINPPYSIDAIKNGINILTGPTNPILLNTTVTVPFPSTGSTALTPLTFCDDCLPKARLKEVSRLNNVLTVTTNGTHSFTSSSIIEITGSSIAGVNGTYTNITVLNGYQFTISNIGTDFPTTLVLSPIVEAYGVTKIDWVVTPPVGGSGTLTTTTSTALPSFSTTTIPNTLNFNGVGTYTITADITNSNTLNTSVDRVTTKSVVYTVTVLPSTPPTLNASIKGTTNNTCVGGAGGQIQVGLEPGDLGVSPYVYTLHTALPPSIANQIATSGSTAVNNYTFTGLSDGTYFILVTDSANQTVQLTASITSSSCNLTPFITNISCFGIADGAILLSIDGSDPDCACGFGQSFESVWSYNGVPQPAWNDLLSLTGLSAGFYDVIVTTCAGCEQSYTFEVLDIASTEITYTEISNSTCGLNNGLIIVDFTHPTLINPIDIEWHSGNPLSQSAIAITNIVGNGTIATVTTFGNHGYSIGQIINISGVDPSVYDSPAILAPVPCAPLSYTIVGTPTADTFEIASTFTTPYVNGGLVQTSIFPNTCAPYPSADFLVISPGNYSTSAYSLPEGTYYFTFTDDFGCTYTSPVYTITTTDPPTVIIFNEPKTGPFELCASDKSTLVIDGLVTENDCIQKPIYVWTNLTTGVSSSGDFLDDSNLTIVYPAQPGGGAGNVVVGSNQIQLQVIDCNGCTSTVTTEVVVYESTKPVTGLTISGGPLTNCPGSTLPYLVEVQGGVNPNPSQGYWTINGTPYYLIQDYPTLSVDNTFFEGPVYSSINPIYLEYFQFDINGCLSSTGPIIVNPPIPISLTVVVKNNPCGGPGNIGEIDVEVLNGCPPYTYSWTGPGGFTSSLQDLTGLVNGTYQVTVTDDAGNIFISDPIVVATAIPEVDNVVIVNTCNNGANGSISFDIINGTAPFTITWDSPQNPAINTTYTTSSTVVTLTGLKNGTYNFLLEDDYGCTVSETFVIQNALPIEIDSTVWAPSCFSACDGRIDLSITGGNGVPYTILWNTGQTTASIEDLCAGTYSAVVTDSNGCSATYSVNINGASASPMEMTELITSPNFQQNTLGSIQITSVTNGGGAPYTYVWTNENSQVIGIGPLLQNLNEGTYTVTVTGAAGCSISRTYTLQNRCDAFSYTEFRLQLYKFQCCAGQLAKKYVELVEVGRMDLAKCLEMDLRYMTIVLDSLSCISEFPDPCLSCDDLNNIFNQMKKICDCDCCESDENAYTVRYDYETQTFIPVIPETSGGNPGGPVQCPPNCPPPPPPQT